MSKICIKKSRESSQIKRKLIELEVFEKNFKINKLKTIEERAIMQRVIKGLKDDMIEKKTIGILKEMDKEFYQNLKKL